LLSFTAFEYGVEIVVGVVVLVISKGLLVALTEVLSVPFPPSLARTGKTVVLFPSIVGALVVASDSSTLDCSVERALSSF